MKLSEIPKLIDAFINIFGDMDIKGINVGTDNTKFKLNKPQRIFIIKEDGKASILISDK